MWNLYTIFIWNPCFPKKPLFIINHAWWHRRVYIASVCTAKASVACHIIAHQRHRHMPVMHWCTASSHLYEYGTGLRVCVCVDPGGRASFFPRSSCSRRHRAGRTKRTGVVASCHSRPHGVFACRHGWLMDPTLFAGASSRRSRARSSAFGAWHCGWF